MKKNLSIFTIFFCLYFAAYNQTYATQEEPLEDITVYMLEGEYTLVSFFSENVDGRTATQDDVDSFSGSLTIKATSSDTAHVEETVTIESFFIGGGSAEGEITLIDDSTFKTIVGGQAYRYNYEYDGEYLTIIADFVHGYNATEIKTWKKISKDEDLTENLMIEKSLKGSFIVDDIWDPLGIPQEIGYAQITVKYEEIPGEKLYKVHEVLYDYEGDLWGIIAIKINKATGERLWHERDVFTGSTKTTFNLDGVSVYPEDTISFFLTGRPGVSKWDFLPVPADPTGHTYFYRLFGQRVENKMTFDPEDIPGDPYREYLEEKGIAITWLSPVEPKIYDSNGLITGWVEGHPKQEIPGSIVEGNSIFIFDAADIYQYDIIGTDQGKYDLEFSFINGKQVDIFTFINIPIANREVHRYIFDSESLSSGEKVVTIEIDIDGNGNTDTIITIVGDGNIEAEDDIFINMTASYKSISLSDVDPVIDSDKNSSSGCFINTLR